MFNIKKYTWILILISAILILMLCIVPNFYYFSDYGNHNIIFLFGMVLDFDNGKFDEIEFLPPPYIAVGALFVLILLVIGVFLLITAFLALKDKFPKRGIIWLIFGFILIFMPILLRATFGIIEIFDVGSVRELFGYHIDLFTTLTIVCGALVTSSGVIEMGDFTELKLR